MDSQRTTSFTARAFAYGSTNSALAPVALNPASDFGAANRFNEPVPIGHIDGQPVFAIHGGDSGYNTAGDALVTHTSDNVDLNAIWAEFQATITIANETQTALAGLLSYQTTSPAEAVPQSNSSGRFVEASEFGEPVAIRPPSEALLMGFTFADYDAATRATWRALRDMDSRQIEATHVEALGADSRLVNGKILQRLFEVFDVLRVDLRGSGGEVMRGVTREILSQVCGRHQAVSTGPESKHPVSNGLMSMEDAIAAQAQAERRYDRGRRR